MAHWFFDAGHGGTDSGAVGKKGTYEKAIVLRAVLKAKAIMESYGEKVTLSRDCDKFVSLADRTALANRLRCDYLVSFHMNSATSSAIGTEVWTSVGCSNESTKLANIMLNELLQGIEDMGYKTPNRGVRCKNFWMVYRSDMPAVLTEGDFISNSLVEDKFNADKYGEIVAKGCLKFIGKVSNNDTVIKNPPIDVEYKPSYKVATVEQSKRFIGGRATDIQKKLMYLGYNLGSWGANGIWGEYSYNALIQFQKENSLDPDGYCGNATTSKLNEKYNDKVQANKPKPKKVAIGNPNKYVQWVADLQAELNKQGYRDSNGNKLRVDGFAGTKTYQACCKTPLKKGCYGNITRLVQIALTNLGFNVNGIDSNFGNGMAEAVRQYNELIGFGSNDKNWGSGCWKKVLGL